MMEWRMRELLNPNSRISGRAYLGWGVALFAFKHVLDRLVAWYAFDHAWPLSSYLLPGRTVGLFLLHDAELDFYIAMLILAAPFITIGVLLTMRRLQTVGLPCGFVVLFFVPLVNLLLFLLLGVLKSKPRSVEALSAPTDAAAEGDPSSSAHQAEDTATLDYAQPGAAPLEGLLAKLVPDHRIANVAAAILLPLPFSVGATLLGVLVFHGYGWGVFVGLPFEQRCRRVQRRLHSHPQRYKDQGRGDRPGDVARAKNVKLDRPPHKRTQQRHGQHKRRCHDQANQSLKCHQQQHEAPSQHRQKCDAGALAKAPRAMQAVQQCRNHRLREG